MLLLTKKIISNKKLNLTGNLTDNLSKNENLEKIKKSNKKSNIIPDKYIVLYDSENNEFVRFNENNIEEALWMEKEEEFYNDKTKLIPRSIVKDEKIYRVLNKPSIYYEIWNKEIEDDDIIWYINTEENIDIKITKANPKFKLLELMNYIQKKHKFKVDYTLDTYQVDGVVMKDNNNHELVILDLRYKYQMYDISLKFNSLNESVWWKIKKIKDIDSFLKKHLYN